MGGAIRLFETEEIQAASVVHAALTKIGSTIDVRNYDYLVLFLDYTKGDETNVRIIPKILRTKTGDQHPFGTWSSGAADLEFTESKFLLDADAKRYMVFDVRGIPIIQFYEQATAGTPTGTLQVGYSRLKQ